MLNPSIAIASNVMKIPVAYTRITFFNVKRNPLFIIKITPNKILTPGIQTKIKKTSQSRKVNFSFLNIFIIPFFNFTISLNYDVEICTEPLFSIYVFFATIMM